MKNLIIFRRKYFIVFTFSFIVGISTIFMETNNFVRSYATDVFAVMYVYFILRTFLNIKVRNALAVTCVISIIIELIQYFDIFEKENQNIFIKIVFGSTFDVNDFIAYGAGIFISYFIEQKLK